MRTEMKSLISVILGVTIGALLAFTLNSEKPTEYIMVGVVKEVGDTYIEVWFPENEVDGGGKGIQLRFYAPESGLIKDDLLRLAPPDTVINEDRVLKYWF
jgi:hypothetical protein